MYTFTSPFQPLDKAFIVIELETAVETETCPVCDGVGKLGVRSKVTCPGPKGQKCQHGKVRRCESRWVPLLCEVRRVKADTTARSQTDLNIVVMVGFRAGVDRDEWTTLDVAVRTVGVDIHADRPVLCPTLGMAARIAALRNIAALGE